MSLIAALRSTEPLWCFDPATYPDVGGFQFAKLGVDFASPVPTILFDNSGGAAGPGTAGVGSIVARSYDLQFSTTDIVFADLQFYDGRYRM